MTAFHRYLGTFVLVLFVAMMVTAVVLRVLRRRETPAPVWALQHWTENLLLVHIVTGIVLLVIGRRVPPGPESWLHYLYGSLFPLIAIVAGRIMALRREAYAYVGLAWGAFFAFALILRAVQTGCGEAVALTSCFLR